jgi:acyl carrier protein
MDGSLMTIDESRFKSTIVSLLGIQEEQYRPDLKMEDVPSWDSVGHLSLIFGLEEAFGVKFEMERILQLDSLEKIRAELAQEGAHGRDRVA